MIANNNNMGAIAHEYLGRGWAPLRLARGAKGITTAGWQRTRMTAADIDREFARPSNVGILLGAPSGGLVDVDLDHPLAGDLADQYLPPTGAVFGRAGKPRSHRLYIVQGACSTHQRKAKGAGMLVELRSTGVQTVFPGSVHPSGELVEWDTDGEPAVVQAAVLGACVDALADEVERRLGIDRPARSNGRHQGNGHATRAASPANVMERARKYLATMAPAVSGQGGHDATFAAACTLVIGFALSRDDALALLREYNQRCQPPWAERALEHKVDSAMQAEGERGHLLRAGKRRRPSSGGAEKITGGNFAETDGDQGDVPSLLTPEGQTEAANSRRFWRQHGQSVRYCAPWRKWLCWDGRRWKIDNAHEVEVRARGVAALLWQELARLAPDLSNKEIAPLVRFATSSSSARSLQAILALARSENGAIVQPDDLDCDPWSINVLNGTLSLRTGTLRPHRREDMLTKLAPVEFDPAADCPTWRQFMHTIMDGQTDLVEYLQRVVGHCLTADVSEQAIWLLHGHGANGKTTLIGTILELLGPDYATTAPPDFLLAKTSGNHPTELTELHGRRFVSATEVEEGRRLAESLVKALTGGETIKGRRLYEDFWEFRPTHKLMVGTNYMPAIRGQDHGLWRRLHLVPFRVQIPVENQDKQLPAKLRAELPGILNWALVGCIRWQAEGLGMPPAVAKAVSGYKADQDIVAQFLAEACIANPTARVRAADLYAAICEWGGGAIISARKLGVALVSRGFDRFTNNGTWYRGIGLRQDDE